MTGKPQAEKPSFAIRSSGDADGACVAACLAAEVAALYGPRDEQPLSLHAYDDADSLVGGLNGSVHWGWFYIRHFWVAAGWRGRGVGRDLLREAESEARARACVGLYLDTFDPGAAQFYKRCGFVRFGRIPDFPPGHARTFLYKKLSAP
jgi:GNAT superfamily N-acetyltransferase